MEGLYGQQVYGEAEMKKQITMRNLSRIVVFTYFIYKKYGKNNNIFLTVWSLEVYANSCSLLTKNHLKFSDFRNSHLEF